MSDSSSSTSSTGSSISSTRRKIIEAEEEHHHLQLLDRGIECRDEHEIGGTPIFTKAVLDLAKAQLPQWGFFAGITKKLADRKERGRSRLYYNIASPSSAFICGSQGSGKSHTLSCLLENCLMKSDASKLSTCLSGLVFHYDSFTSNGKGTPCEAAFLSSEPSVKVSILCSPTNVKAIQQTYSNLKVSVQPLKINQQDLNTQRMMELMAVDSTAGMPLYLHTVHRILREMRLEQQSQTFDATFNYLDFKKRVTSSGMTPAQLVPLAQRLDTLESFMPEWQVKPGVKKPKKSAESTQWSGCLTIVDLSCPCVTPESACSLFNICLNLFLDQRTPIGRVIALDEAHKYMDENAAAETLTNTLYSSVREQRHIGVRVFISTQEPGISPKLLDLCSTTIVHRFSSPEWFMILQTHLAAASSLIQDDQTKETKKKAIFNEIIALHTGDALLFAPSAMIGIGEDMNGKMTPVRLGTDFVKISIRARLTDDGGKSIMAA